MKLSIIIVNYNVKYFLRQLIQSIHASSVDFTFEIIVVDNASTDGSVEFLRREFSQLRLIINERNLGFSKANNIGIGESTGEYVLLLNPDTILQEDTLQLCVSYMDSHPKAGALGCRMIDGSGHYLPESKRGFPSPRVALFKNLGLSALFPQSGYFNEYYLGNLNEFEVNEVDVLTGAFMLLRREALDKCGLLDEDFFMYGEDIDLSYRIKQAGYQIIYFPRTTIIHFKGESTRKQTVTYIKRFYGAMQIFANKHYDGQRAFWLRLILQLGIVFRAGIAILGQLISRIGIPVLEWVCFILVLDLFSSFWANFYYDDPGYYQDSNIILNIISYASIWMVALLLCGAYDRIFKWRRIVNGIFLGWISIAAVYGFLGPEFRPSRSLVFAGGFLVAATVLIVRLILYRLFQGTWPLKQQEMRKYAVVGPELQAMKIEKMLRGSQPKLRFTGYIHSGSNSPENTYLGTIEHLDQIVRFHRLNEVIFCADSLASSEIMQWMTRLGPKLHYKIAPAQPMGIIGSSSKNSAGELYTFEIQYKLGEKYIQRNKRLFDIISACLIFVLSPVLLLIIKDKLNFFNNIFQVFIGNKTWVTYGSKNADRFFPRLKRGILHPALIVYREDEVQALLDSDYYYARDYSVWKDLSLIINNLEHLGRKAS